MQDPLKKPNSISLVARRVHDSFAWLLRFAEKQILEFARDSRRDPEEFRKPFMYRYGLEITIAVAIFAFFVTTFGPTILFLTDRWTSAAPVIPLDASRWKILYDDGGECGTFLSESCVGHPTTGKLWASTDRLSDDDHSVRVQAFKGKKFWAGLELTPEEVRIAFEKQAPVVELGLFNAGYRVWVNGVLADNGDGRSMFPSDIHLGQHELATGSGIRISIEVFHKLGSRLPIWAPKKFGGVFERAKYIAHRDAWLSFISYRSLTLIAWAALLATIFGLLWMHVSRKTEYFFFALYLLLFAMLRVFDFGPISYASNREEYYVANFWLVLCEGVAGVLLGLSYARVKKKYMFWAVGLNATIGVSLWASSETALKAYLFKDALEKFNTPLMFLIGSLTCVAQFFLLRSDRPRLMNIASYKARRRRLLAFASTLFFFAVLMHLEFSELLSSSPLYFSYTGRLGMMAVVGAMLLNEFRDRERQFEVLQRSPFHDPYGGDSAEVFGFILSIDLINSSSLTNFAADLNSSTRPVTIWNTLAGELFSKIQGFKVADEGDGLKLFFHSEDSRDQLNLIVESIVSFSEQTSQLEAKFRELSLIPSHASLTFRAGLIWGGIHPIWKEFIGLKTAEWQDAVGQTTFKDVTRIMELEKTIRPIEKDGSLLVISSKHSLSDAITAVDLSASVRDVGEIKVRVIQLKSAKLSLAA